MQPIVVLTCPGPSPAGCYIIETLASAGLVDVVGVVAPERLKWKVRQFFKVARRSGLAGVWERFSAGRLYGTEFGAWEKQYEIDALFPGGAPAFPRLPANVRVEQLGGLGSRRTVDWLRAQNARVAVQVEAGWIREPLISIPQLGFLSLHHGYMPRIRGMLSILWAYVEDRADWLGITLQWINEGLDTGRIAAIEKLTPAPGENPFSVVERATRSGAEMLRQALTAARKGERLLADVPPEPTRGAYRSGMTRAEIHRVVERVRAGWTPTGGATPGPS